MQVYIVPADAHGCGHYRLIWPGVAARAHGVNVTILEPGENVGFRADVQHKSDGTEKIVKLYVPSDADVIVMQRPAYVLQPQMINIMRQAGIAVVIDMDDDVRTVHSRNPAGAMYRSGRDKRYGSTWTTEACNAATLITTSTRELARLYGRRTPTAVLDNYVPKAALVQECVRLDDLTFGWAGLVGAHPDDPMMCGDAVRRLIDDNHTFRVVGPENGVASAFRLRDDAEVTCTGVVQFDEWLSHLRAHIGVGMAPLAPTAFNTSKSRLKPIEYMSQGIPWVGSPRAEYRRLAQESRCGSLADTPRQWYDHVRALLKDDVLWHEQSARGIAYMRDQTYEAQAWRWVEAWQRAYDIERGKR